MARVPVLASLSRSLLAGARAAQARGCGAATALLAELAAACSRQELQQQQQHPWAGVAPPPLLLPHLGFAAGYAKQAKGSKKGGKGRGGGGAAVPQPGSDDDEEGGEQQPDDEPQFDPAPIERLMQQAVDHLQHELAGVRTGRANPGLLENLSVDAHGDKLPLKACGSVTVRSPQLLAVVLFDASLAKAVEKAIRDSPLSLAPTTEGSEVLVKLPRMTQDTIDKMIKLVNLEAEGAHQSIRRARQKGMDGIRKGLKAAGADDKKRAEKEVQRLHDAFVAEVERLKKAKAAELHEHKD